MQRKSVFHLKILSKVVQNEFQAKLKKVMPILPSHKILFLANRVHQLHQARNRGGYLEHLPLSKFSKHWIAILTFAETFK